MDTSIASTAPFFDPAAVERELASLVVRREGAGPARAQVLERLKSLLADARAQACRQLESDGNGRRCARRIAAVCGLIPPRSGRPRRAPRRRARGT